MVANYDFSGDYYVHSNNQGNTWILTGDGIYYYNTHHQRFIRVQTSVLPVDSMERRAFVTDDGGFGYFHLVRDKFLITHSIGLIRIVCR